MDERERQFHAWLTERVRVARAEQVGPSPMATSVCVVYRANRDGYLRQRFEEIGGVSICTERVQCDRDGVPRANPRV